MSAFWTRGRDSRAESENAAAAGARVRIWQLTAADRCDRCGAQAYVRVLLPRRLELLFCAHHSRQYSSALANIAVEIQDETIRLACCALCGNSCYSVRLPAVTPRRADEPATTPHSLKVKTIVVLVTLARAIA